MLFRLKMTKKFIDSSGYDYSPESFPILHSGVGPDKLFCLINDSKYITYNHKVNDEEKAWMCHVASLFYEAVNHKRVDVDLFEHVFYKEFKEFSALLDCGVSFVKTSNANLKYSPELNNGYFKKKLCGIKDRDEYYFCDMYCFNGENNIDLCKTVFNEKELENSLGELIDLLEADDMAVKVPFDPCK